MTRKEAFRLIDEERLRQFLKWGKCLDRVENPDTPPEWKGVVLGEEFGEVCKSVVERSEAQTQTELVHLAAVAVAWLESLP